MNGRSLMFSAVTLIAIAHPAWAGDEKQDCAAGIALVRARAETLPKDDLSRRFAEADLDTALAEIASGDAEECRGLVTRAMHTIRSRPYQLYPGEVLDGYGPDTKG